MNTTAAARFAALQPLVSVPSRVAAALAVAGVMALALLAVQDASHEAVRTAAETFSSGPAHVTLAPVQVVGRRASLDANSI
jgi:hypothetical protein